MPPILIYNHPFHRLDMPGHTGVLGENKQSLIISSLNLQLAIHVVQNHHAGMQKSHWDKTDKGNYHKK